LRENHRYVVTLIQKFQAPEPLPPIDLDDIGLVVWMAVEAEQGSG